MKKSIVIYYSYNGSNHFLANKVAENLDCKIEEIKPRLNKQLFLVFGSLLGNKKIQSNLENYDRIILCGPIWMGKFISPLKDFVKKYKQHLKELVFISCCGSGFEMKDKKFGHGLVFKEIKEMLGEKCNHCEAFPITLLLPDEQREDPKIVMNTRLTEENFKGEILQRFNSFIKTISHDEHVQSTKIYQ